MEPWEWAILLRPLLALVVLAAICIPVRLAAQRWIPEGRIKRLLLRRL
jgi:hypothetical protein